MSLNDRLRDMLSEDPQKVADYIKKSGADDYKIVVALEILGECNDSDLVRATLLPFLNHENEEIREGAIYGLWEHLDDAVRCELLRLARFDPSNDVRGTANAALDM